jgi:electron transfer flavoprotein alpha subunit
MTEVWVVAVPAARQPDAVTAEMLGEARRLGGSGGTVNALLVGSDVQASAASLAPWGLDAALVVEHAELATYHPERFAPVVADAIRSGNPQAVLFAGTVLGMDLGARVAEQLGRRFHPACVNFELSGDEIRITRAVDAGRLHQVERAAGAPFLLALQPATVGSGAPGSATTVEVRALDVPLAPTAAKLRDLGFAPADPRTMDLVDADVIVAGGRGMGGPEGFALLDELADRLGGCLGASRPAVEAGWAPYERQVGQTGRTVKPKLYVACGISGATQHLAGMRTADAIIAVNKDPSAPIFNVATLAIEGDLHEVLEALLAQLRRRQDTVAA